MFLGFFVEEGGRTLSGKGLPRLPRQTTLGIEQIEKELGGCDCTGVPLNLLKNELGAILVNREVGWLRAEELLMEMLQSSEEEDVQIAANALSLAHWPLLQPTTTEALKTFWGSGEEGSKTKVRESMAKVGFTIIIENGIMIRRHL